MKKLIISLAVLLTLTYCKGPGAGPLQRDAFTRESKSQVMVGQAHVAQVNTEKTDIKIDPCEGCITISGLLENKKSYSGKIIRIKGKVTKVNPEIMGKNWVHIQDGSEYAGGFDLTITTDIKANVGDTITFEGKIVLDKDFGYGYVYSVLMEDGKPVNRF